MMDNKNFNADQSIELIQRMIRDTRRNLSSGSSNLFILWEYLLAATAVGIFLLLTFTESRAWQWLWLPALAAGWAATWWYNRRRATQVKSYTDRLLEQIWECIAGLAAFSTFVICMEREWPVDPLFPALLLISAGASHAAAPAITGEMQKKYESMQSFTAEFTQRLVHQESGSEETRQGTLAFQKPLRVRWETKAPHAELLVITDKDVWDYLPDEELAYQYSPEVVHDSRSIIQVITGQSRLDKDFTVEAEPDDNGLAVLRLYPKDPSPQLVEALLWVDKGTKLIKKAQILDFYGNTNEVALTSLTPDASIKAGTFQFTPPQGITVEDLMNQDAPERPLLQ